MFPGGSWGGNTVEVGDWVLIYRLGGMEFFHVVFFFFLFSSTALNRVTRGVIIRHDFLALYDYATVKNTAWRSTENMTRCYLIKLPSFIWMSVKLTIFVCSFLWVQSEINGQSQHKHAGDQRRKRYNGLRRGWVWSKRRVENNAPPISWGSRCRRGNSSNSATRLTDSLSFVAVVVEGLRPIFAWGASCHMWEPHSF